MINVWEKKINKKSWQDDLEDLRYLNISVRDKNILKIIWI